MYRLVDGLKTRMVDVFRNELLIYGLKNELIISQFIKRMTDGLVVTQPVNQPLQ